MDFRTSIHSEEKQETPTESSEGPAIVRKQQKAITQISRACKGTRRDAREKPQRHQKASRPSREG